uniref:Uncharacterized protein n=1 Tax=Helicotheca tamesis TaxID=374047 RepID=A0A7S2N063_9STRA|eukprot:CAMPEP_0185726374 /NCGR_PEP_ID=MMETSP1171-20130828/2374_1 /TAXON_ID=374046 /ORGANISM="Helicotheca tamensis, Strain CCMP826" /LENGTH=246 /DNA_ID=CAMNT_0028394711 /DNA_START=59 /DNA_END=799 /DNA_ORIENTATION=-
MATNTTQDDDEMRRHQVEDSVESESDDEEESDDEVEGSKRKSKRESLGAASLAALAAAYVNARNSVTLRALYSKADIEESKKNESNSDDEDDRVEEEEEDDDDDDDTELKPTFVKYSSTSKLIARESYATATPREKAQRLLGNSDRGMVVEEDQMPETVQEGFVLDDGGRGKKKKRKSSRKSKEITDEGGDNKNITPLLVGVVAGTIIALVMYVWSVENSTAESEEAGGKFDWHHGFLGYGRQREL